MPPHHAPLRLWASACISALIAFAPVALAHAEGAQSVQPKLIRITGPISSQTYAKLSQDLNGFHNSDPIPAGLIVLLNSPGGDGDVAIQMGRLLRKHQAHVFVTRQCDSACVLLLMGGVVRAASPGSIGVHAGRLTVMTDDGRIIREVDANQRLDHAFQLVTYNRDTRLYLQEMGIDHGILDVMLANRTSDVYRLSAEEIRQYRLIGFDNAYLNQRVRIFETDKLKEPIDRVSLFTRTMSVPVLCRTKLASDQAFVDCYSAALKANAHKKPG